MAEPNPSVDLLNRGIVSNSINRGGFAKNVFFHKNKLEIRRGLGQLAEFDVGLGHNFENSDEDTQKAIEWGYQKHLGSHVMETSFGHTQIVSVFLTKANTTNELRNGMSASLCVVSIYDVTTDDRWEQPIHRATGENNREAIPMPRWRPLYATCIDRDYQDWIQIEGRDSFYFVEFRGLLLFGSKETGLLVYHPTVFDGNRRKQADKVSERDWRLPYGESAVITRAAPSAGVFEEGVVYLTRSELPNPVAVTVAGNRVIYATGRTLYFSEPGQPTNIRADNFITLSDITSDITAVASQFGNIHIYTKREVWTYHPSEGADTIALGRLNPLSRSVGCSGKNAICYAGNKVVWADQNGVYATSGNYVVENLSMAIDDFFRDRGIADPVTSYFVEDGRTRMEDLQPKTFYYYNPDRVHISYWPDRDLILMDIPEQQCTLVYCDNKEWSLWVYESRVQSEEDGSIRVRSVRNIQKPWLLPLDKRLFAVGGAVSGTGQELTDETNRTGGQGQVGSTTASSYYVLEYGRGGALDRNVAYEDDREISAKYDRSPGLFTGGAQQYGVIFLGEWERMKPAETLPGGGRVSAVKGAQTWLVPVIIVPRDTKLASGVTTSIVIDIDFDHARWSVLKWGSSAEVAYILPTERLPSNGGYSPGTPNAGTAEVQAYAMPAGTPSTGGNQIRIRWDAATAGISMNLVENQRNVLMYLPVEAEDDIVSVDVAGMGFYVSQAIIDGVHTLAPCVWSQWSLSEASQHTNNNLVTQGVDWCYRTPDITPEQSNDIVAYGIDLEVDTQGDATATDHLAQGWLDGVLNVTVDRDGKMYQAQRVDYQEDAYALVNAAVQRDYTDLQTVKETYKPDPAASGIERPFFDSDNILWSDPNSSDAARYLVTDSPTQSLSTGSQVGGKKVAYMLHGHMRHRAHRLILGSLKGRFNTLISGVSVRHSTDGGGGSNAS